MEQMEDSVKISGDPEGMLRVSSPGSGKDDGCCRGRPSTPPRRIRPSAATLFDGDDEYNYNDY